MRYDSEQVRDYYDTYGDKEWHRLEASPEGRVSFHLHQNLLLQFIEDGDRVLEAGPGPGRFTLELAALGARVVALDISPEQLRLNRERMEAEGVVDAVESWVEGDVVDLSRFSTGEFDAVVAYGGPLSYVCERADQALAEMLRITKAGGYVLLSVMSRLGTSRRFVDSLVEFSFQYGLDQVDEVTRTGDLQGDVAQGHRCHMYSWSELRQLLERHNCDIVAASASGFLSLQSKEALRVAEARLELWEAFLGWEELYCSEPGALDGGTHIIAVVRKRSEPNESTAVN